MADGGSADSHAASLESMRVPRTPGEVEPAAAPQRRTYHHDIEQGKRIAEEGDHIWGWGTPGGQLRAARRTAMYREYGKMQRGQWTLEVGCGTGIFTERIHTQTGARVVAFDVSWDVIRVAKGKAALRGVHFVVATAEALPFRPNIFESAYGSSILHHVDVPCSLAELQRVTTRRACCVFTEPNMLNPQVMLERNVRWVGKRLHNTPDETAFVRWPLAKSLTQLGFTEVRVTPFDFLHPFTPRALAGAVEKLSLILERIPLLREIAGSLLIAFRT